MHAPAADVLADLRMEVETPEHVAIEYPLAGLGSRFAALMVDGVIVTTLLVAGVALAIGAMRFDPVLPFLAAIFTPGRMAAVIVLWVFTVTWGYFFWCEAFRDGQTVGKQLLGIRTIMDGGYPLTIEAAAIRNLVRAVDVQAGGLVGGFFMLLTRQSQRLGDLAANTVVVRELPAAFPAIADAAPVNASPRLDDTAFTALEAYADRRNAFDLAARDRLATELTTHIRTQAAPLDGEPDDAFLVRLHGEERGRRAAARLGGRAGSVAAAALLRSKRERWETFRADAARVRRTGLAALGEDGVGTFAARYREVTADLARARTYGASRETLYALERLVSGGHNLLYQPARQSLRRAMRWLLSGFPALVRRRWVPIAVASGLLFGPAVGSYALLRLRPDLEAQLVDAQMIARADEAPRRRAAGSGYVDVPDLGHAFMSSALVSNNVQVAFTAFAAGITAGLGTALVMILNGLHLGSVLAAFHNRGALDVIALFVLPHGILELTAIVISGGAGLWMGSALLLPGRYTRRAALARRAPEAVALIGGVIVLLMMAALIEGYVSPAALPDALKIGVSALSAVVLGVWLSQPAPVTTRPAA
ncbi:MAG TPA: stage II sporulation protein M [Candidatus Binatia bacterium]|jgi:uncharacterized membrane protein SpoIIM required for sporulation/uncharacterized RDD family membrane protein YckC|nr:stage II sporulation protein M [Candidatus Binatia bacterium]